VQRETITHSQLDHPNIIPLLGVYAENAGRAPMTVLPYVEKGSLADVISCEPVKGRNFARIVCWPTLKPAKGSLTQTTGIGRALAYLHSRNPAIYHGDLHTVNFHNIHWETYQLTP